MPDTKLPALTALSAPALDDLLYAVDVSDTTDDATGSSRSLTFGRLLANLVPSICQGRLTTESGVSVSTSDRTAQSTLRFTPHIGNRIALFDGTRWGLFAFSEISLALSGLTSARNYDVFVYDNAGTLTIELSAAWTNDTTRADALTTQDGVLVKSGSTTRRYLGTIRTTSTTATEDSFRRRFVWNAYNQVRRSIRRFETTASWTYTTDTYQQANASATNQVELVCGVVGASLLLLLNSRAQNSTGSVAVTTAIGEDATTPATECAIARGLASGVNLPTMFVSQLAKLPAIGYHYYTWLERSAATGTTTWFGLNGASPEIIRCGLNGVWEC